MRRLVDRFMRRYAEGQAADVAPFIEGPRLLDLGAGEGYVAAALARRGQRAVCADVGPFRRVPIPYVVYDGRRLPFRDATFDTTFVLLTLHPCAAPEATLDEAIRVTRGRLIVTESVYRSRAERFWLRTLDGRLNRFRHNGTMAPALEFGTPGCWTSLFASRRLRTLATRWLGRWWERLVHHPLLYVLERTA